MAEKFDNVILSYGFKYNKADRCIYSKFTKNHAIIIYLYVYVDDVIIFSTNIQGIKDTKKYLTS